MYIKSVHVISQSDGLLISRSLKPPKIPRLNTTPKKVSQQSLKGKALISGNWTHIPLSFKALKSPRVLKISEGNCIHKIGYG